VLALLVLAASMAVCEFASAKVPDKPVATLAVMVLPQDAPGLVIENESQLPDTHPHAPYEMRFQAHGNISTPRWRVEKGALPEGMKLEEDGRLHGRADHAGEFQFTVSVIDGGRERGVQKGFVLRVTSALSLNWKAGAHVNGNRIEGSVQVSNTTPDDVDLTYYVLAVAPNGRATAIGYQHFVLKRGTTDMELPFGETLPHGGYLVHVDAVGEVAAKNVIYRESLDTPERLQVTVGP
jgi:hypothetical protein